MKTAGLLFLFLLNIWNTYFDLRKCEILTPKYNLPKISGSQIYLLPIQLITHLSGTIIRGTLKTPNSQLVTPISIKLQRPDGCD
jgi:hypothetical protein